jgi:hypothetical protein
MTKYDIKVDMTSTLLAKEANSQWILAPGVSIATRGTAVDASGVGAGRSLVFDVTLPATAWSWAPPPSRRMPVMSPSRRTASFPPS